jgi:DNA-binding response OmpR family regulator
MKKSKISPHPILIVEDNENDLEMTLDALRSHHILNKIEIARDGSEALNYLFRSGKWSSRPDENPALVILDLRMPKVSGLEVLKEIKHNEKTCTIPVVILTSSCEERDIVEGYQLGTNAYVVKPIIFNEFVAAVTILGTFWAILNEQPV